MGAGLTFYTNPQSRGAVVRWMLEELGEPYETVLLEYGGSMKAPEYLAINPMGKVPALRHGAAVITECAAICAYLADAFPAAGLAPPPGDRADYYRWLFFAAGPLEAAFSNKALGWEAPPERQGMLGYGNFDAAVAAITGAVAGKRFIAGDRFSAADVHVGSLLDFMIRFGQIAETEELAGYLGPLRERPAYLRARAIDAAAAGG